MTPEDAVVQAAQQLTAAIKGKLKTAMDESVMDQLNKLDAIFNTTSEAENPDTSSGGAGITNPIS